MAEEGLEVPLERFVWRPREASNVSRRRRSDEVREGALEEPHRFREEPACVFDRSAGRC